MKQLERKKVGFYSFCVPFLILLLSSVGKAQTDGCSKAAQAAQDVVLMLNRAFLLTPFPCEL
jgi:hypothetical protein